MTNDKDDLDALIRAAATPPMGTEARLKLRVMRRMSGPDPASRIAFGPAMALAGFSALLVATPILIASSGPGADALLLSIIAGDTTALGLTGRGGWQ